MKNKYIILLLLFLGLAMNSCYYDEFIEEEVVDIPDDVSVSFSNEIQPIFSQCIGCHNANNTLDLREGNSYNALVPQYVSAGNSENSRLYNYLPGTGHFDVGLTLSNTEIALIKAWIDQGALNN